MAVFKILCVITSPPSPSIFRSHSSSQEKNELFCQLLISFYLFQNFSRLIKLTLGKGILMFVFSM